MLKDTSRKSKLHLPGRLLKNNIPLTTDHYQEVKQATDIEREWYKTSIPFKTFDDIQDALKAGQLESVNGTDNYLPILRFRNPKLSSTYPPYLKFQTKTLLDEVASRWREECNKAGINPEIRLAVTALVMTEVYRDELLRAGKLAIDKGPHVLGEAFDIDGCGYYLGDIPVNPRPKTHTQWDAAFQEMGAAMPRPDFANYAKYDPRVHEVLKRVLDTMMKENKLHYVLEYPGSTNASFHICRHPNFS